MNLTDRQASVLQAVREGRVWSDSMSSPLADFMETPGGNRIVTRTMHQLYRWKLVRLSPGRMGTRTYWDVAI